MEGGYRPVATTPVEQLNERNNSLLYSEQQQSIVPEAPKKDSGRKDFEDFILSLGRDPNKK